MDTLKSVDEINRDRRRFVGSAAMAIAAAQLGMIDSAVGRGEGAGDQARDEHVIRHDQADRCRCAQRRVCGSRPGQWRAGHPAARLALRHSQLRRRCAAAGLGRLSGDRSLPARLRHDALPVPRNGRATAQPSALAVDLKDFLDALKIEKPILAGFDWGARTANIFAALWPERMQGHGLRERLSDRQPGSRQDALAAERRAPVVVPVLFRHRTRPRRLRQIPARVFQADLADRFAEVGVRRRHVRSQRCGVR